MTDLKQAKEKIESEIDETIKRINDSKKSIDELKINLSVHNSRLKKVLKLIEEANKVME